MSLICLTSLKNTQQGHGMVCKTLQQPAVHWIHGHTGTEQPHAVYSYTTSTDCPGHRLVDSTSTAGASPDNTMHARHPANHVVQSDTTACCLIQATHHLMKYTDTSMMKINTPTVVSPPHMAQGQALTARSPVNKCTLPQSWILYPAKCNLSLSLAHTTGKGLAQRLLTAINTCRHLAMTAHNHPPKS
jgi:hypothetical protein